MEKETHKQNFVQSAQSFSMYQDTHLGEIAYMGTSNYKTTIVRVPYNKFPVIVVSQNVK